MTDSSYHAETRKKGFLLAAETVLSLVVLICYADSSHDVSVLMPAGAMIFSAALFVVFATERGSSSSSSSSFLRRGQSWLYWADLLRVLVDGGYYLASSCEALWDAPNVDAAGLAGAAFGLAAGLVYAWDAWGVARQLWRRSAAAAARRDAALRA